MPKEIKNKIYDLSLVVHWDDNKDSWLGINDINKSTLKTIIKEVNQIFDGCLDKKYFDIKEVIDEIQIN